MIRRSLFTVAAGAAAPVVGGTISLPTKTTDATVPTVAADHVHPESVALAALLQDALSALHYLTVMWLREVHGERVEGMWEADAEHFEPQSAHERAAAEAAMVRAAWWRATAIHGYTETPFFQNRAALAVLSAMEDAMAAMDTGHAA